MSHSVCLAPYPQPSFSPSRVTLSTPAFQVLYFDFLRHRAHHNTGLSSLQLVHWISYSLDTNRIMESGCGNCVRKNTIYMFLLNKEIIVLYTSKFLTVWKKKKVDVEGHHLGASLTYCQVTLHIFQTSHQSHCLYKLYKRCSSANYGSIIYVKLYYIWSGGEVRKGSDFLLQWSSCWWAK